MDLAKRIGTDFDNVSQRLLYNYIATQPDFRPVPSDAASETAQRQLYDWIGGIYTVLYHDPTLIGMTTEPDETEDRPYPDRIYKDEAKKHLEARRLRRKNEDKIEGLLATLGNAEAGAYDARWRQETGDGAGLTWQISSHARYLVQIKNRIFKRALFDPAFDYALEMMGALSDDPETYRQFADMLLARGFEQSSDWGSQTDVTNFITLAFTKTYASHEGEPLRLRFMTQFESRYHRQILYTFIEDKVAIKTLLRQLETLPEPLQDLVYGFTGECRACGFCNQTNRKLPPNFIPAVYRGKPVRMCYYFKTSALGS